MDTGDANESDRPGPVSATVLSQQHLETIFSATHDVVIVLDGETQNTLYVNETVYRVLGYTPEALLGQPFAQLLAGDDPECLEEAQLVDGVYGPIRLRCASGEVRHADVTVAVVPWDGHPALLYSLRDVTERTRFEADRAELIEELKAALATVRQLSGLLPICANCKSIRNDSGYWATVEQYLSEHTEAQFSHGICPKCCAELYPEYPVTGSRPVQEGELS